MKDISLRNVYKSYQKNKLVIEDFSLEIFENEFLVLVGPSGSGKTTILRMIAGLEEITDGEIYIDGDLQNDKDPSNRHLSFVFQNYALLPNLTVYENIEFGLLNHKIDKFEKKKRIEEISRKLSLMEKLGSYPHQLSGGQRQRVALARALVDNNKLILFDEPLSNLDAVLRTQMRSELIRFQNAFSVTSIYVTHDQIEAMAMSSRIVLIMDGHVVQVGTPEQMYHHPVHLDAATFMGSPESNVLRARYENGKFWMGDQEIIVHEEVKSLVESRSLSSFDLTIRPQDINVFNQPNSKTIQGIVSIVENFGFNQLIHVECFGQVIRVLVDKNQKIGKQCYLDFTGHILVFDKNKKRVREDINQVITIDFNLELTEQQKLSRELKNYGYDIRYQEKDPDIHYDFQSKIYVINKSNQKIEIKEVRNILNHYGYIK